RLALVVRPGNRGSAGAHVKIEQLLELGEVQAEVFLQRRYGALHEPPRLDRHTVSGGKCPLGGHAAAAAAARISDEARYSGLISMARKISWSCGLIGRSRLAPDGRRVRNQRLYWRSISPSSARE